VKHTKQAITTKIIMGLFNFFKKKSTESILKEEPINQSVDNNAYLLGTLKRKLLDMGYKVEQHPQYLTLIINSELEISTAIVDIQGAHPFLMQLNILTVHPVFFKQGIYESLAGIGKTMDKRVNSAVDSYLNSTFSPIIDGFSDTHDQEVDLMVNTNERKILWHPKLGDLLVQGQWDELPDGKLLFEILKDKVKPMLTDNKFNWLKIYISKRADGTIIGECLFNNQLWNDGLNDITKYAESWTVKGEFMALKQFIMFRKCDLYD
jgi:hypothetical protein